MFLDLLQRRNGALVDAAMELHQAGELPANTFVLDLDAVTANAAPSPPKPPGSTSPRSP